MTLVGILAMLCIAAALAWPLRGTTLWPIALPIALAFSEAGFVQTSDLAIQIPLFPVALRWLDIVFGALVVAWLLVRRLSSAETASPLPVGVDVAALTAWLAIVVIALPLAWIDGGAIKLGISWILLPYCYVPLSTAMLYDVLRRTTRAAMWTLLRSLSVVVSVVAAFYMLHMLGWSVYDLAGVNSTYSSVGEVRRDTLTFPYWAYLTIPFLLWSERIRVVDACMIVLQITAVATSVTRSLILGCFLAVAFVMVSRLAVGRRPLQPLVPVSIGIAAFAVLESFVPEFVSRRAGVVLSRFDELSAGVGSVPTIAYRLGVGARISSLLKGWSLWMGPGFSDVAQLQTRVNLGKYILSDSLWTVILFYFGAIGVAIVGLTLMVGVGEGVLAVRREREEPLALAAVGTAALLWLIARTVASSEIMEFNPMVCALVLALIMLEARDAWSTSPEVRRLLLERGEARTLPEWLPQGPMLKVALVALAVVAEIAIGRAVAR